MVSVWAVVVAWVGVVPVVWCLALDEPSLRPYAIRNAPDNTQRNTQDLPLNFKLYDDYPRRQPSSPRSYGSEQPTGAGIYEARAPYGAGDTQPDAPSDVVDAGDSSPVDPRLYLWHYLNQHKESENNARPENDAISNLVLGTSGRSDARSGTSKAKKNWSYGVSRRRTSGLSLSIDASMKVLREALYLEIVRKKQRQQLLRARQNQELLTSIGKRDSYRAARSHKDSKSQQRDY